ncbi:MAG: hypothetical protein IPL39_22545 [Opitutaceae bacterium]|nr:hypothetical protein [Opitutaceae bacterium]
MPDRRRIFALLNPIAYSLHPAMAPGRALAVLLALAPFAGSVAAEATGSGTASRSAAPAPAASSAPRSSERGYAEPSSLQPPASSLLPSLTDGPAEIAPLAAEALLLDLAAAGNRLVAVGERGHILLSDDQGGTWRQAPVPTRATLTAVTFTDPRHGWAVGHLGTLLRTVDAGETWQRLSANLDRESVLLDVLFLNANEGFAVGAYGLFLRTRDGGATWTRSDPQPDQYHFNQIVRTADGAFFLCGEAGTLLRSLDGALSWEPVPPPYDGSLFGLVALADGQLLVHGLRGHVFRSTNGGAGWLPVATSVPTLLMHGLRLRNGLVVLAGQSGNFFLSRDRGQSLELWRPGSADGVSALLETTDGSLLLVGEKGVRRIAAPPLFTAPAAAAP